MASYQVKEAILESLQTIWTVLLFYGTLVKSKRFVRSEEKPEYSLWNFGKANAIKLANVYQIVREEVEHVRFLGNKTTF